MDERLIRAAEAALRQADLLNGNATVLVALSGGADSVALLLTLDALRQKHGLTVRAAHVEHGLRGDASLADAQFCEALCRRLSIPFFCEHARMTGDMHSPGVESEARKLRYHLLITRAKEAGADALLLAHHQDDQAETVLQHLLRGSGARGLSGMKALSERDGMLLCRPFLSIPKQVLLDSLENQEYRTDESNQQPVCQRNRLRQDILPALTKENPAAIAHIAQSAALLQMDEACLWQQAETLLQKELIQTPPYFCLRKAILQHQDNAIALRVLRRFVEIGQAVSGCVSGEELSLSADDSLAMLALLAAEESTSINLPGALHATATARFIHLTHMQDDAPLTDIPPLAPVSPDADLHALSFGDIALFMMPHAPGGTCPDGKRTVVLTREQLQSAVLREPKQGDMMHPFGANGKKPLRRYLTDHKLDLPFRKHLPVVAVGSDILWAVGVGAAESTRVEHTPSVLLTLQGDLPWLISSDKGASL